MGVSGEFELIAAIRERVARAGAPEGSPELVLGSGDDAAVTVRDGANVVSVDALVEGVHFRIPPFTPCQVGHKALAVALSDLAAMGASAGEAYVQLGVPPDRDDEQLLELADGLASVAAAHRVAIAGGDVTRAPALLLAVTVVGGGEPARLVARSGARAGDLVAITGALGGAAAGLLALERPELSEGLEPAVAADLIARQVQPEPRLEAGTALALAGVTAMIDVSDGLGADASHLAEAGDVGLRIELARLPVQDGVAELAAAAGIDPLDLAAGGGEDYELLVTIAPGSLDAAAVAVAAVGSSLTVIGEVVAGSGVTLSGPDGDRIPEGFDQLRSRRAPRDPA